MKKTFVLLATAGMFVFAEQTAAQNKTPLSDPEVASVAVTANQIDVNYGEIARKKSKDAEVLKFAETMINDHKAVISQATALVKKLGVTPKDNKVSRQLLADSKKTTSMLQSKSGAAFNKAYIDNEVNYHKAVISTVENVLIPDAQNSELKELLQNVVPTLKAHLEHAMMVQSKIEKS